MIGVGAAIVAGCSGTDHAAEGLWYVNGAMTGLGMRGQIEKVSHAPGTPEQALNELVRGPTQTERAGGLITAIPARTRVESISISNSTAHVRLASSQSPREWRSGVYASAQIVYTLTEFPDIVRVVVMVNGERCCLYDMHGRL